MLVVSICAFSQSTFTKSFTLDWNNTTPITTDKTTTITIPTIVNHGINSNNIPHYTTTFNVQSYGIVPKYHVKNVKFEKIEQNLLKAINLDKISDSLTVHFNLGLAKNKAYGVLALEGLVKQNGQVLKITAFDFEYTIENNARKYIPTPVYKQESVLNQGQWYKFAIDTSGVFKLDKAMLENMGINTKDINPRDIRIYGNGGALLPQLNSAFRHDDLQENAILVHGEDDGIFNNDDFILFYGQGPESWHIDYQNINQSKHINNIYSDKAYYFITADLGPGKRISTQTVINQEASNIITTYQDFVVYEKDNLNLFSHGQQWLGEDFSYQNEYFFTFPFEHYSNTHPVYVKIRAAAISSTTTKMSVQLNNQPLFDLNFNALSSYSYNLASVKENTANTLLSSDKINLNLNFDNGSNPSARAYLDYIEIIGTKNLVASNKQFTFTNTQAAQPNLIYEFQINQADEIDQVWDISNPLNPVILSNIGSSDFVFKRYGNPNNKFVAISKSDTYTPEILDRSSVTNQNLHGLQNIDYLIVTRDYLSHEAEKLAQYHRNQNNLNAKVVTLDKIYNEFASGSPDLTAIRDFIRMLYYNSKTKIKFVCLFGDASFDFKDRITNNNNIVPAFQSFESFNLTTSYVTDDYFGMMDASEGELKYNDLQDVATGRYTVTSALEASATIAKTLNYYHKKSFGHWRNLLTFVADDPDHPTEYILQQALDNLTKEIADKKPSFNIKKIYADAYQQESTAGGERYPSVNEAISNAVETGTLLVDYFGHGGINGWANERILEVPEIQNWFNPNALPLFVTVTCDFTKFDNPLQPTAGEYTFLNANGGASNMITTTREIFINVGQSFNQALIRNLLDFENNGFTISEALMYTKHQFSTVQRLFIQNLGDPAMSLAIAQPNVKISKLNGIDISQSKDTLKALSKIRIEGMVTDENDQILNHYNGTLFTTIYDKALDKTTLDNDNFGRKMTFKAVESKIFSGKSSVENGLFNFEFIVPKDIRIAYGNAKVSFYSDNQIMEKGGYNNDLIIGGINTSAPQDNEGPIVELFMNDESFVDGGNTNESPILYAIMQDESGINTSITAVDHDIIAILDGDEANPIMLNDYYETELNNFKKGKVKYPLRNLEPGLHTVKIKVWDTYNNPSETTLSFIVVDNNNLVLSNVLNYPNPFVNYTEFWFNHNKPNEPLEVQVQIFTISGKLIKTLNQSVQSDGLLSRDISWNGLDDFGNKIGKGVYIYKLRVQSRLSNTKAEKIEKLVILQ